MKYLLSLVLFSFAAYGQVTFTIAIATDPSVSVTMSAEAVSSMTSNITGTVGPGTSPTTLTANATNSQTTFQVASVLGVTTCMGILTGSELSMITGISGTGPYTLTVVRGTVGTTKAAHSSGDVASYAASGNGTCLLVGLLSQMIQNTMVNKPGPLVTTQQAAIVTANATIATAVAAGVTHVP